MTRAYHAQFTSFNFPTQNVAIDIGHKALFKGGGALKELKRAHDYYAPGASQELSTP